MRERRGARAEPRPRGLAAGLVARLLLAALALAPVPRAAAGDAAPVAESPEQAAIRVLDAFMAAFNARDVDAWIATWNFPHVRFAGGKVAVYEDAASFRDGFEFARFAAQTGWSRSEWTERRVVQAGPDKVHVAVAFTRFREDGSVLARFESLYVITRQDGRWGVQARSSYAP